MKAAQSPRMRLGVLAVVILALFAALFARLWFLQVLSTEDYVQAAEANRVRVVQVEAPRGRILDRNGTVLVDNRVSTVVTVDRVAFNELPQDERIAMLNRLADELSRYGSPTTFEQLVERVNDQRYSRYAPVPVAEDVTEKLKIYVEEHADLFPSVSVERTAVRNYNYGSRAAHLIGYVGEINDTELEDRKDKPKSYIPGSTIGKSGVERVYEDVLRGKPGRTVYEVDADGKPVRVLEDRSRPPIPGDDVWLTIDVTVQSLAEDLLVEALDAARERPPTGTNPPSEATGGSVVVLDPRNGSVLAMASYPTYDPSDFVNGISSSRYAYLTDDANHEPLTNRATQGQYAPGSTFKLFTGYAALATGLRDANEPFVDEGSYTLENCSGRCTFDNAGNTAYGVVDMARAITVSSDAYFYAIGADFWNSRGRLGEEALQEPVRRFGFGQQTGVPLPAEQDGRIPSPEQRRQQFDANPELFAEREWYTGDNVNMAIGQGGVAVTPLQLANAYATFANGGTRYAPNIALKVTRGGNEDSVKRVIEPRINGNIELPPHIRDPLLQGLAGVTTAPKGTATAVFSGFPHDTFPVAGKTGTAEVNGKADTAVFSAFGPVHDPQYQVAVVMEESGFGGVAAAPVARKLFDTFAGVTPRPELRPGGELVYPEAVEQQPTQDQLASVGSQD